MKGEQVIQYNFYRMLSGLSYNAQQSRKDPLRTPHSQMEHSLEDFELKKW